LIYGFIAVGFAEPRLPKGSVAFYFLPYLTKKIAEVWQDWKQNCFQSSEQLHFR